MRHHEIGPHAPERVIAQPKLFELSRPKILDQCIGARNKAQHDRGSLRMLEVQRDRTLVASMQRPPERVAIQLLAPLPHRITVRRLDLDYVRTEIAQEPRTERAGYEVPDLD